MDEPQNQPISQPSTLPSQQINLSDNKVMAILAYLGILIIVPFLTGASKNPFVKFHIKQGLALIIVSIVWGFVASALGMILATLSLGFLTMFFSLVSLGLLIIDIIGLINAANGKMSPLPIVGGLGNKFTF